MSDEETAKVEETPAPETPETPASPEAPRNEDQPLGEAGQKALDAFKQRAKDAEKELKELRQREQEREDAEKSELEKAQTKLERTNQELTELQTKLLRSEVADELEVPAKLRPLLTATSKEDLESQAKLILENAAPPKNPEFDGGPREITEEPLSPEDAHQKLITGLFGGGDST